MLDVLIMILLTIGVQAELQSHVGIITKVISVGSMGFVCIAMLHELKNGGTSRESLAPAGCDGLDGDFVITDPLQWFNLKSSQRIFSKTLPYIFFIDTVAAFEALAKRQRMKRSTREPPKIIFDDVSRKNADESSGKLLKFLVNYGFYKFGIEITLFTLLLVIFTRHDVFAILYTFWFVILVFRSRAKVARLWKVATLIVTSSILVQPLTLAMFIVLETCLANGQEAATDHMKVLQFLYINLQSLHQNPGILIGDFLLLMFMSSQV